MMMKDLSLSPAISGRGVFCKVELHCELTDLTFESRHARLVFADDVGLSFFVV